MAYISSIGNNHSTCLLFNDIENALKVTQTLLCEEQRGSDRIGQYAIMVSLEESLYRLDIVTSYEDDFVVFGTYSDVEEAFTEGEDEDDRSN